MNNTDYDTLTSRNLGYIDLKVQELISKTRILVAGCGMGSAPTICAVRTGFQNFILADGDVVETHNLNRQFYRSSSVGRAKVDALADEILSINPLATVEMVPENLTDKNIAEFVSKADIIFDTIDFVDLKAVIHLHEEAQRQHKPIITAINVGFGALVWHIPAHNPHTWPSFLKEDAASLRKQGEGEPTASDIYLRFVERLRPHLDNEVNEVIDQVLRGMKENQPCPAPQLAVGSFSVAALATTMMHDILAGKEVVSSPELIIHSYRSMKTQIVSLM